MIAAQEVWERVSAVTRERIDNVRRYVNEAYYTVIRQLRPLAARKKVEIDLTDGDSEGVWLPGDLFAVQEIADSDGNFYDPYPTEACIPDVGYAYVVSEVALVALYSGSDATIDMGADQFTVDAALSGDPTGEYVQFGNEPGYYEIVAANGALTAFSISPRYYGPSIRPTTRDRCNYRIRPEGTRKIKLLVNGSAKTSGTITVQYFGYPPPLYRGDQRVLVPDAELVVLRAAADVVGLKHKMPQSAARYNAQYEERLSQALADLRGVSVRPEPRQDEGELFVSGQEYYDER